MVLDMNLFSFNSKTVCFYILVSRVRIVNYAFSIYSVENLSEI